ncbi:isochorismatase family protein [Streptomyces rhizosphaericola]|uniref:isochorismatase family protein n=1 Tax=Streptomyces rhizosphaericola TaxID=2564098 RepID=UPI0039EF04DA
MPPSGFANSVPVRAARSIDSRRAAKTRWTPTSPLQPVGDQADQFGARQVAAELAEAAGHAHAGVDKTGYTLFTPEAAELIRRAGWTDLVFCGIATESCVLKSAADAFEHGYAPWIVTDACASDAGPDVHDAGLLVARRLIGTDQLVDVEQVMGQLDTRTADPVLE